MYLLHDLGAEAGQLCELLQVLFLGHSVDLDREQRCRVYLCRDLGVWDFRRKSPQIQRFLHFPGQPLLTVLVQLAGLENLADNALGLLTGDFTITLRNIDHAA